MQSILNVTSPASHSPKQKGNDLQSNDYNRNSR